jgi:hypothetical protein
MTLQQIAIMGMVKTTTASFTHREAVVKLDSKSMKGTAFKVIPDRAIDLVNLDKENLWFTAGHLCSGVDMVTLSVEDQKIEAQVKGVNTKYDWCYLTTEPTTGPGYYLQDTCSKSESRTAFLYTLSNTISLSWSEELSMSQLFGITNSSSLPGDSGAPLLVDGFLRSMQIELSSNSIIFSNIYNMVDSILNYNNDEKESYRIIKNNDNTSIIYTDYNMTTLGHKTASKKIAKNGVVFENWEQDSQENQKASKMTDENGRSYENWYQDSQGNQKASKMTYTNGYSFKNWEQDSQGNQKASKLTNTNGNSFENWERDFQGNQKASKRTTENGSFYENWEEDSKRNQKASKLTDENGISFENWEQSS